MNMKVTPHSLERRMVLLSYFAYFFYYFTRKHLGITTNALVDSGYSENLIVAAQTGYGVCYAIGQFLSGSLGDRFGPRLALCVGMILSAIASLAFGIFPFMGVLVIGMTLNGLFQATGWSNSCKVVSCWVPHARRGRVMGFWLTCYIVGSLSANFVGGYVLGHYGWREVFLVTGVIVIIVGVIQGLFLINRPEDRGYELERRSSASSANGDLRTGFGLMIRQPAILCMGLSYTGLKFVRYTFFAWLPYYLATSIKLADETAAYVSNGFEVGGVVGLVLGGFLADRFFVENRARLAFLSLLGMVGALFLYRMMSGTGGVWGNVGGLAAIGFFLYIADSIISGTAAQDVGGAESTASAAGIVNGIGSLAQPLSGFVPIWLKNAYGWDAVFVLFIVVGIFSSIVLVPLALKKKLSKA